MKNINTTSEDRKGMAINKKLFMLGLFAIFALAIALPNASAVALTACTTINTPGTYTLSSNIVGTNPCFTINTNNVVLDCNGNTITGPNTGRAVIATGRSGITINNCVFSGGWDRVIDFTTVSSSVISNNIINAPIYDGAIHVQTPNLNSGTNNNNIIENNVIALTNGAAITLFPGSGNVIRGNTVSGGVAGIAISGRLTPLSIASGNQIINNILSSHIIGIDIGGSAGTIVSGNTISNVHFSGNGRAIQARVTGLDITGAQIFSNMISDSDIGLGIELAPFATGANSNNVVFNNNFINNAIQARIFTAALASGWSFSEPSPVGGNYWNDYDTPGEGCNDANSNGFCDAPYVFLNGQDDLPLAAQLVCGNGVVSAGEACDQGSGNVVNGDGCSSICRVENGFTCTGTPSVCTPVCGDGLIKTGEQCDQGSGNVANGDGCSLTCQTESGYACTGEPSICAQTCGNGVINAGETCDQGSGNVANGDGCSSICTVETGFTCTGTPSVCAEVCGNGIITASETCDDGNTNSGDGCSATCTTATESACGKTILSASTYKLWKDETCSGTAFTYVQSGINANVLIDGQGHTITSAAGTGYGLFFTPGAGLGGLTIKNLNLANFATGIYLGEQTHNVLIENNIITRTSPSGSVGILAAIHNPDVRIIGNTISGPYTKGIKLAIDSFNSVITGNTISGATGNGISLETSINQATVSDNIVTLNGGDGIFILTSNNVDVLDNQLTNNVGYGLRNSGGANNVKSGNTMSANDAGGFFFNGALCDALSQPCSDPFINNTVENNLGPGVTIMNVGGDPTVISNNIIRNNAVAQVLVIDSEQVDVASNEISGSGTIGVDYDTVSTGSISGNTIQSTETAVRLRASSNVAVTNNGDSGVANQQTVVQQGFSNTGITESNNNFVLLDDDNDGVPNDADICLNTDQSITLTADDGPVPPMCGVSTTLFCVDTTDTCIPSIPYTSPFVITQQYGVEGINFVRFQSVDNFNQNTEFVKSLQVAIDKTPPTTTGTMSNA